MVAIKPLVLVMLAVALSPCGAAAPGGGPAPGDPSVPPAITALIHELEAQPPANPRAYVASYKYAGQLVYYVPPRCCDIFSDLYNQLGEILCHPDGGLAGSGDGRCPDFTSQRTDEKIIWRDLRPAT